MPNTKKVILASDIDGVVYPFMEVLRIYIEKTIVGQKLQPAKHYQPLLEWGISKKQLFDSVTKIMSAEKNHQAQPILQAKESLWQLHEIGVSIIFLTRRAHSVAKNGGDFETVAKITKTWLKAWAPPHEVFFVDRKTDYQKPYNLLVDDDPQEIYSISKKGRPVVLFDQKYNQQSGLPRYRWQDDKSGKIIQQLLKI